MSTKILLPITAVLIAGGILAPPVQASPNGMADAICTAIDNNPSVATVTGLVADLVQAGASPYQAGTVIAESVINHCTRNIPVLDRFVLFYSPVQQGQVA